MLKIRLSRAGKKNMPFFRVVLTEHTKAAKHGYKKVLWFYNPISKEFKIRDVEEVKKYLWEWVQLTPRMLKLMEKNKISV
jgi:small subunit ribosomal protein S16